MKVTFRCNETDIEGDYGMVPGIEVECHRCGHTVEVFGTEAASIRRAAATLRHECPRGENNFYEEFFLGAPPGFEDV